MYYHIHADPYIDHVSVIQSFSYVWKLYGSDSWKKTKFLAEQTGFDSVMLLSILDFGKNTSIPKEMPILEYQQNSPDFAKTDFFVLLK
jgi:hypothetical protein